MDFAVQANHRIKIKESEKIDKYLNLAWELKKLWNMKVIWLYFVFINKYIWVYLWEDTLYTY